MTSHSEQLARRALLTPEQRAELEQIEARAGKPTPSSSPAAITPELRNPDETPAEHIRNAMLLLSLCNLAPDGKALILNLTDADAVRSRLRAALKVLEVQKPVADPAQQSLWQSRMDQVRLDEAGRVVSHVYVYRNGNVAVLDQFKQPIAWLQGVWSEVSARVTALLPPGLTIERQG